MVRFERLTDTLKRWGKGGNGHWKLRRGTMLGDDFTVTYLWIGTAMLTMVCSAVTLYGG